MTSRAAIGADGGVLPSTLEPQLVGRSDAITAIAADVECAARSDAKVLITGETGVGKDVVAQLIHRRSVRAPGPYVTVNCAGLPDSLLESELFGHAKGSFTGAYRDKPGLLETAAGGTVFLDEVGEMSARMQVVLLRFLETGEIQRVGSDRSHTCVDVRLITATNRDLPAGIASGRFREDLYFRLNVIRVGIPPLRERIEDIPLLIDYYLDAYSRRHGVPHPAVSPQAMATLLAYRWPGNVRELKNVVERILFKINGRIVRPCDLPTDLLAASAHLRVGCVEPQRNPLPAPSVVEELTTRMLEHGESFWSSVYPLFMSRDMHRDDLRRIVKTGLEVSNGNYRRLTRLFNMPDEDYKRFLNFLRKHQCQVPFRGFRLPPGDGSSTGELPRPARGRRAH